MNYSGNLLKCNGNTRPYQVFFSIHDNTVREVFIGRNCYVLPVVLQRKMARWQDLILFRRTEVNTLVYLHRICITHLCHSFLICPWARTSPQFWHLSSRSWTCRCHLLGPPWFTDHFLDWVYRQQTAWRDPGCIKVPISSFLNFTRVERKRCSSMASPSRMICCQCAGRAWRWLWVQLGSNR